MLSNVSLVTGEADAGLRERLDEEISAFNAAATGHHDGRPLSIAVCGDRGDLRAGLYGWTWGGCGYIDLLWVRDDQRSGGLGTKLLAAAEAEMQRRGCGRVALSTHSFQAPAFYARAGYTECGRTSEYAFNRAFTRDRHIPPNRYRTYGGATQLPTPSGYPARPAPRKGPSGQRQVQPPST